MASVNQDWDIIIKPRKPWFNFNGKELWHYKDLLFLFVRRDFVALYKQTILGPLWFFIQPVLTTITFTIVFGKLAGTSPEGSPQVLFFLSGIVCWTYFSECLTKTANTFTANADVFGKVYFPRVIIPLSIVVSNLIKFGVQFILFLGFIFYFYLNNYLELNANALWLPLLLVIIALMGLGFGLLISALTTKYRDFQFLVGFGVQLFMYLSPVVYPLSRAKDSPFETVLLYNPMTPVIEAFRNGFVGELSGQFSGAGLIYSSVFALSILLVGMLVFNKVEKNFMDTV